MNAFDIQEFRQYIGGLSYFQRKALKESEIERLAYLLNDPLKVMSYLESVNLFWY